MDGEDGVTVLGCHSVPGHQNTRVPVTAGTTIGATEINGQQPLVNTTEDAPMATTGVDDATASDLQFAKLNQELELL